MAEELTTTLHRLVDTMEDLAATRSISDAEWSKLAKDVAALAADMEARYRVRGTDSRFTDPREAALDRCAPALLLLMRAPIELPDSLRGMIREARAKNMLRTG